LLGKQRLESRLLFPAPRQQNEHVIKWQTVRLNTAVKLSARQWMNVARQRDSAALVYRRDDA
jgi:hypothetical protein